MSAANLDNAAVGFALVCAAGASTALGAAAVFEKRMVTIATKEVLAASLGFSGGVMLYVSFVEIFVKSQEAFGESDMSPQHAYMWATFSLFAGIVILRLIAFAVHKLDDNHHCAPENNTVVDTIRQIEEDDPPLSERVDSADDAHGTEAQPAEITIQVEVKDIGAKNDEKLQAAKLKAMGLNTAAAIAIHNFPEGLATFVATLVDPSVGVTLAVAIGIHNIPEGLCVAVPIYYATNSRLKGFLWAMLSGISEPIGALIGYAIIKSTGDDMNPIVYGVLFGVVAGMMIMIVVLELLPTAYRYDTEDRFTTTSVVVGMLVMAASLCLFMI
eukprot:TRINITY_DN24911_c0_g1_i2.p1 TRINITY_DN24911_c0_g1~~TRINITY_DN24911_c0_g1_i2.p1  ORF type:complete len:348 (-),score=55.38 TRINITY_DN24911_c0_g1_i2:101-1084(-)